MAVEASLEGRIREWEERLARSADGHPPLTLTPAWWQERLLQWATDDPEFRVKLLRFVDVLPTLRSARAIADHVRQYFRGSSPGIVETASGLAAQPVFRPVLSRVVRQSVFSMAGRFIAGETGEDAVPVLRELASYGVAATVDLLGEETLSDAEADAYLARYMALLETLSANAEAVSPHGERWDSVPAVNISVKLSALCAHLEPAAPDYVSETARSRLRPLLRAAIERTAFINFDMEQFRYKDLTHRTFEDVVLDPQFAAYPHLGIVVQAYLKDARDDVEWLAELAKRRGTPFSVRLVKGAYWDEERIVAEQNSWPVPVFEVKADTDRSFEACTDALLAAWPHLLPAIGSHNPRSVAQAIVKAREAAIPDVGIEFQTLYGMAEGLRTAVAEAGFRTRVYTPVGEVIPGMAYLVRRLLENTSNQAWFNTGVTLATVTPVTTPQRVTVEAEARFRNAAPSAFFEPEVRERMQAALDRVERGFGATYPLLIGGSRIEDRALADVRYPADPEGLVGRVAQATAADVDAAVAAARASFPAWRDLPAWERTEVLHRAAELVEKHRFDLAALMVFETAKPWHEADGDVCEAIDYLRYYADQGERLSSHQPLNDPPGEENEYFYEGVGVTAVIAPWNFPLAIITGMAAGALAGGNAAILKPAAQSPIIAYRLVEILHEAGVLPEVVQYLPGPGGEVGRALVEHAGVDNIAFTGSSEVGLGIIAAAARTQPDQTNVKRVVAEMGGKNAVIIDDDADLDQAVHAVLVSAFGYAGQKCSACSRLVIVGSAYEPALSRLRNAVASLVVGAPEDPATQVPPVISAAARDKILGYIKEGKRQCTLVAQGSTPEQSPLVAQSPSPEQSTLVAKGPSPEPGGHYVPPAVFADVPLDSPLAQQEIFGPVLTVFRAKDFEEALQIAMNSRFALTGGVFSRNPRNIELARRAFRVGNLYINRKITGAVVSRQPFGGLAMSGVGEKAGGPDYVRQFMAPRVVSENTVRRGFAPEDGA
jgi:RHH-type proline utilization regulon transcriptional repressor/proline dehydrogenase/delta 1-pyrroline-5-carboxylate dehydrogenase